jgi:V/A-type H+-transporting ATPase subunit C
VKRPSRSSYAYAVGRVRALERGLIPRSVFCEAAGEKSFLSALKLLFDAGEFFEEWTDITDSGQLDDFLGREEGVLMRLAAELLADEVLTRVLDRLDYPDLTLAAARSGGSSFVVDYLKKKIDLMNLKLLLRVKHLERPREDLEKRMLFGGNLDTGLMMKGFRLSPEEFGETIRFTDYAEFWSLAVTGLRDRDSFSALERGMEDFLMQVLLKAKYIVFGSEPVFAYALARKHELGLVRLVGVGKLNQIPPETLESRIGLTYV